MPTYISLLRGVNVGGARKIRMADLSAAYESLSLTNVHTYVQSGNVVFDAGARGAPKVATAIETQLKERFGFDVTVLVRTAGEFEAIVKGNPFAAEAAKDPTKVYVTFLADLPERSLIEQVRAIDSGDDTFSMGKREIFLYCPNGYGRSKLNNAFFERKLKTRATTRNWKTVRALCEMAARS